MISTPPQWHLGARPEALLRTAMAWRDVARAAGALSSHTDRGAKTLLTVWEGEAADAYGAHHRRTVGALSELSTVAQNVAGLLEDGANVTRHAQNHLDDTWRRISHQLRSAGNRTEIGGDLGLLDANSMALIRAGEAEAQAIRAGADATLLSLAAALDEARRRLGIESAVVDSSRVERPTWLTFADTAPAGAVIIDGDRAVVNATGQDDQIFIGVDPTTGEQIVRVADVITRVPAGLNLIVRAGGGNDTITVSPRCQLRFTLIGGAGNDVITGGGGADTILGIWGGDTLSGGAGADRISGGEGRDYLDGQAGDDLLVGGEDDDTLYGLDGNDLLDGGQGIDYLDGGRGNDRLAGGAQGDVLVGGHGDDLILGGADNDVSYAGPGADRVVGGGGDDRAFVRAGDSVGGVAQIVTVELAELRANIRIEGTPDFVARIESDLDALNSSPRGIEMLAALAQEQEDSRPMMASAPIVGGLYEGDTLLIRGTADANGYADSFGLPVGPIAATVRYNPTFDDLVPGAPTPPVVVLYHELAHVYDDFYSNVGRRDVHRHRQLRGQQPRARGRRPADRRRR